MQSTLSEWKIMERVQPMAMVKETVRRIML
jgi:hypothetical protein